MPPLTTSELVSFSPSITAVAFKSSEPTLTNSFQSSFSSFSSTSTDTGTGLPRTIAIFLASFGALVILTGIVIVMRSRIRIRKELKRQDQLHDAAWNDTNESQSRPTEQQKQLQPSARRLKALSFLQGREGPKEWIPGGGGGNAAARRKATTTGVERSRSKGSLRKSFLTLSSSLSRKSTTPSSRKSTPAAVVPSPPRFAGAGGYSHESPSTERLYPIPTTIVTSPTVASISPTSSPSLSTSRSLSAYQSTVQDLTMTQRSSPPISTTVRLQRNHPTGLTVHSGNSSSNNNISTSTSSTSSILSQLDVFPPVPAPARTMMLSSSSTQPTPAASKRVSIPSEPYPLGRIDRLPSISETRPIGSGPIRPGPAPQLGINRVLDVSSPLSRPAQNARANVLISSSAQPPSQSTRSERLGSLSSMDEPSLISYYYDGPRDFTVGIAANGRRPSNASSTARRI